LGDHIEKNVMGGAGSMYGGKQRCGNLRKRDYLEDPGIDGGIILRWIFRKWALGAWAGSIWLRIGTGGTCECSNELSGYIKCGEFLD
jgi:hypothetical protein